MEKDYSIKITDAENKNNNSVLMSIYFNCRASNGHIYPILIDTRNKIPSLEKRVDPPGAG